MLRRYEPVHRRGAALVSTPSYDTNQFILGLTTDQWDTLNNDESQPLYNRFRQTFARAPR